MKNIQWMKYKSGWRCEHTIIGNQNVKCESNNKHVCAVIPVHCPYLYTQDQNRHTGILQT